MGRMRVTRSSDLPDVLAFMEGLWAVVHRMERLSKQMGAAVGVTGPQRLVLRLIGLFPGISAGDLAATLHLHPSTLTGVLKRLEEQQLLTRTIDAADRRRTILALTRRGRRLSDNAARTVEGAVAAALEESPRAQRVATRRFLERLAACLDHQLTDAGR
jgi:DNA-binding MarR family transcriptional regulator